MLLRLIHTAPVFNSDAMTYGSRLDALTLAEDLYNGYITGQDLGEYRLADLVDIDALHILRGDNLVIVWQENIVHVFEIID